MKPTCITFLWIVLAVLTGLAACKKDEPTMETSVEGYVQDATTGKGFENAKVYLENNNSTNWMGSAGGPVIDSLLTPANGYYTFHFTAQKGYSYYVDAEKSPQYSNNIQPEGIIVGTKNNYINLLMSPLGYIRIFVKNVPPANESDTIMVYAGGGINYSYFGKSVDNSFGSDVYGNKICLIVWFFSKIVPRKSYKDSVYVPAFDTVNYYLNY